MLDVRDEFPILQERLRGHALAYLDNAASSQVPRQVLDAFAYHYSHDHSNIHRGAHALAERSTQKYEDAREKVARFIGASPEEIIFTKGTTESNNLVAYSLLAGLNAGDEIVVTAMDHHSNFVMWQMLAKRFNLAFKVIPITQEFRIDLHAAKKMITARTKLVAIPHVSNVLGTINDVRAMADIAHSNGALLLVDGAQAVAHIPVDVRALGADFYSFSSHKMYAPTGVGVLYADKALIKRLAPFQYGGGMIEQVTNDDTLFTSGPAKFEAGTPNIAGVVCLGAAIDFIRSIGFAAIQQHEQELTAYALERIGALPGVRIIGPRETRTGVVSFVVDGVHAHDVAAVLDAEGVAVRAGHHCAQPLASACAIPATVRASFAVYTTKQDIDRLAAAVVKAQKVLA